MRLLQKKRPASTRRATPTIGTTTATAIVPPVDSPPLPLLFDVVPKAAPVDEVAVAELDVDEAGLEAVEVSVIVVAEPSDGVIVTIFILDEAAEVVVI